MRPTVRPRRRRRDGFQSRWTLVKGIGVHHRESLDGPAERCPVVFMHGLALDHVTLLANSFGCQVAVDLAVRHPNRVRSLVLVGPSTDPGARTAARQLGRWLHDVRHEDLRQAPILARDVRDAGVRRVAATFRQSLDPIEAKLPLVAVPTLVVCGGLDPVAPQRRAETAARLAPLGGWSSSPELPTTSTTAPPTSWRRSKVGDP